MTDLRSGKKWLQTCAAEEKQLSLQFKKHAADGAGQQRRHIHGKKEQQSGGCVRVWKNVK